MSCLIDLFHGDKSKGACGIPTTGGTESIIISVLTHREYYCKKKGIKKPNMVCSRTVHGAFDKACFYLGVEMRKVDLKKVGEFYETDINGMKNHIDSNTIMMVGSSPDYGFGMVDNMEALGKIALRYDIGLHSDTCLGSLLYPFSEEAGFKPPFVTDFRVEGVTAVSCDPHKYGYGPKGNSVVLFRT